MKESKRGRPAAGENKTDRIVLVGLRGTREYADWFAAANLKTGVPKAVMVRQALKLWAEANNLPEPPAS